MIFVQTVSFSGKNHTTKKFIALALCLLLLAVCLRAAGPVNSDVRSYDINRRVSDFPTNEDLSTPEAAYATLNRALVAEGDAAFPRLSVPEAAETMPSVPKEAMPAKEAGKWLDATILEAVVYCKTNAGVFARVRYQGKDHIDVRWFTRENGRWLNNWHDSVETLDEACELFSDRCVVAEARIALATRPPIAHPQKYLRPFVKFLRREAADPKRFLLQALANHRLVILGEFHNRPRYWSFYSSLVRDPAFAQRVGVIYLELAPGNGQALADQFLAATNYDPQPIIEALRDYMVAGWSDAAELEFFRTVWEVNQGLPKEQRLRIVFPDRQWPWEKITTLADWEKYGGIAPSLRRWPQITTRADLEKHGVDRNQCMADNILRDLREHAADPRHALFIAGCGHAFENLTFYVMNPTFDAIEPQKSAAWRLRKELGERNVFAVFPHSPAFGPDGVDGRIALGLFETAFAALTNQPMAFPLDRGPFGKQIFDASMGTLGAGRFRDNFQAYLYLGPYEDETNSASIPGFYTDDFMKELDRRYQIISGKGLVAWGVKRLDPASFMEWISQNDRGAGYHWGQPTWPARNLGPIQAWEFGSDWKKKMAGPKTN